jgi:serine/threonine protein phosphatase PrpC
VSSAAQRTAAAVQLEVAILSRPGGRERNEDACGHWHSATHLCCVVADGAGGHGGGDVASRLAVRNIIEGCAAQPVASPFDVRQRLERANEAVVDHRADAAAQAQMHTTVVGLFVDLAARRALWGHCGDSRLYVFRAGKLVLRTRDHSVVQSLVDAGLLDESGMRTHPQRSELLSALGTQGEDLMIDSVRTPWPLKASDVFLLCTDGLWEYVDDEQLGRSLAAAGGPHDWLAALEALVLKNAAHKPKHDNFSALTVWISDAAA